MTATTTAVPTVAPTPRAAAADLRGPANAAGQFDRHLDAAKQQAGTAENSSGKAEKAGHRDPRDAAQQSRDPPRDRGKVTKATALPPVPPPPAAAETDVNDQAAAALASAMLALLGPAIPAIPGMSSMLRSAAAATTAQFGASGADGTSRQAGLGAAASTLWPLDPASTAAATAASTAASVVGGGVLSLTTSATASAVKAMDDALSAPVQAALLPSPTLAPVAAHLLQLPSPVGSQAFTQELGQQIAWLGGQDIKQARIRLHPDELGQLDVKVSVLQGRVDVAFNAQHPAAVTALQQSLVQLDQMLAQHGLTLGHAEVGQQDRGRHSDHGGDTPKAPAADDIGEVHGVGLPGSLGTINLLDAFA